ncbi:MAG: SapC family protein [Pseudomonadota bacterium]
MNTIPAIEKNLPPCYRKLIPLVPDQHALLGVCGNSDYTFAATTNSFPLAVDEFAAAQKHYPILFTVGEHPMPAALVSLQDRVNPYVDAMGHWLNSAYVPAYVRRFPFMLLRAQAGKSDFALCIDPTAQNVGDDYERKLFADGEPTPFAKSILDFCVAYQKALDTTRRIGTKLRALDLFTEPTIKVSHASRRIQLTGFQVVDEQRLRQLPDDRLADLARSGLLGSVYAHLFSLSALGRLEGLSATFGTLADSDAS